MDFKLNHLEALHWMWAVAALVAVMVIGFLAARRDLVRFADAGLLERLVPGGLRACLGRRYLRAGLLAASLVLLVAALVDPRWGVTYQHVPQRGVDIVVVLDVSRSMLAEDATPNRLDRARQFIDELLGRLGGDRVALVTFAGKPSLSCPLTVDDGAFRLALATAGPDTAPRGGSLLGDALREAAHSFTDEVPDHKVILVFSDGEDQGSYPVEAARQIAAEQKIPIYTVGIGDADQGARIPVMVKGSRVYLTYEGQEVWSRMDPTVLRDVAVATGGGFIPVGTGTLDMGRIYSDRIAPIARRDYEAATVRHENPQYQWFAGAALLLLLIETMTPGLFFAGRRQEKTPGVYFAARKAPGVTVLLLAVLLLGAAPPRPAADLLRDARQAMAQERYEDALDLYGRMRAQHPDAAEIPFDMGVAAYRKGDFEQAAKLFDESRLLATDPALRARSAYNLGTTAYRRSIQQENPTGDSADLTNATKDLRKALDHFRETLDADPDDQDARANGELAWRWLKQLEQLQQQQNQQQDDRKQQQEQQDDPQQQNQQQQDQQQQDQQQQDQQQQDQQQQDQQQQNQQQQDQQQQDQQQQDQQQQNQQQQGQQQQDQQRPPGSDAQTRPMSREEAERLLQAVRDKERQRRLEQARLEAARQPPVDKDW